MSTAGITERVDVLRVLEGLCVRVWQEDGDIPPSAHRDMLGPDALSQPLPEVLAMLAAGRTYVDPVLGIVIGTRAGDAGPRGGVASGMPSRGAGADLPGTDVVGHAHVDALWYVAQAGGWPHDLDGAGQVVAVIDSGVVRHHPGLRRTRLQFHSLEQPADSAPQDPDGHGTACVGIIAAAHGPCRLGVAPACTLVVGQHTRRSDTEVTAVDYFLLLALAIHRHGARVVSFSFGTPATRLHARLDLQVYATVARRLRESGRALLLCATGNGHGALPRWYPAAARGVVAVGGYTLNAHGQPMLQGVGWQDAGDAVVLLGPAAGVWTLAADSGSDRYALRTLGGTSAACAFVAGVAALYFQWLTACHGAAQATPEAVLAAMLRDARQVHDPRWPGACAYQVRFPRQTCG